MPSLLDVPWDRQLLSDFWNMAFEDWVRLAAKYGCLSEDIAVRLIGFEWPKFADEHAAWQWLYVARRSEDGVVKVGISSDPIRRVAGLSYRGRARFKLVAALPYCSRRHERALLTLLRSEKLPDGVEWFRDTPSIRAFTWAMALNVEPYESEQEFLRLSEDVGDAMVGLSIVHGYEIDELSWYLCKTCRKMGHREPHCPIREAA